VNRFIQELIAQATVETLIESILLWLSERNAMPSKLTLLVSAQDRHTGQFGSVV
jgi:hypothetical protein